MKAKFDLIESRLQALIEGSLSLLFPAGNSQRMLARQLVDSMHANLFTAPDGRMIAPHLYLLSIHPERERFWQSNQNRLDELAQVLYQAGRDAGFHFLSHPILQVTPDLTVGLPEIRVSSLPDQLSTPGNTSSLSIQSLPLDHLPSSPAYPPNAFLIVNGSEHFPLNLPVINIGRRSDNHLVINDPRVSRSHAQIRAIRGRFVVFDLNSSGGTYVNAQSVTQHALSPGDVISLAGVALIYGQDQPLDPTEETSVMPSTPPQPKNQPPFRGKDLR